MNTMDSNKDIEVDMEGNGFPPATCECLTLFLNIPNNIPSFECYAIFSDPIAQYQVLPSASRTLSCTLTQSQARKAHKTSGADMVI